MSRKDRNRSNLLKADYYRLYTWIHPRFGKVYCSILDLVKRYPQCGIKLGNLLAVIQGYKESTNDWRLHL